MTSRKKARQPHGLTRCAYGALGTVAVSCVLLCLPVLATEPEDTTPPNVLVARAEPFDEQGALELAARVSDPAGIADVILMARGEREPAYRPFPMTHAGDDRYRVTIPAGSERGERVAYYVEATDRLGNGPARNGSPDEPFLVQGAAPKGSAEATAAASSGWTTDFVLGSIGLVLVLFLARRARMRRELDFWHQLLAPLERKRGKDLAAGLEAICSRTYLHPRLGEIRIQSGEALTWLGRLRELEPARLKEIGDKSANPLAQSSPAHVRGVLEKLEQDIFWIRLLGPLVDMPRNQVEHELERLATLPHNPPGEGEARFDTRTLRLRLLWARQVNPRELHARWNSVNEAPHKPGPPNPSAVGARPRSRATR